MALKLIHDSYLSDYSETHSEASEDMKDNIQSIKEDEEEEYRGELDTLSPQLEENIDNALAVKESPIKITDTDPIVANVLQKTSFEEAWMKDTQKAKTSEELTVKNIHKKLGDKKEIRPTKKVGPIACKLCRKDVKTIRQHLMNTHKMDVQDRKFLLSYYRTKDVEVPVYQCMDCVVRFYNPWRDHLGHYIIKVRDKKSCNSFPTFVKQLLPKYTEQSRKARVIIEAYKEYVMNGG